MRDIETVINSIIKEIPEEYPKQERLVKALKGIINSAHYTAPEAMRIRWAELQAVLEVFLGNPNNQWQKRISLIVRGELS